MGHWGVDNRSVGRRVLFDVPDARRIENRLAGADANPYLAIAAWQACGYIGMAERLKPSDQIEGSDYIRATPCPAPSTTRSPAATPRARCAPSSAKFMRAVDLVKRTELEAYTRMISSWEREHLLLNV